MKRGLRSFLRLFRYYCNGSFWHFGSQTDRWLLRSLRPRWAIKSINFDMICQATYGGRNSKGPPSPSGPTLQAYLLHEAASGRDTWLSWWCVEFLSNYHVSAAADTSRHYCFFFNPKTPQHPEWLLWDHTSLYFVNWMIHLQSKVTLFNHFSSILRLYCDACHGCDVEADLCQGSSAIQYLGCCRGRLPYFGLIDQGVFWDINRLD